MMIFISLLNLGLKPRIVSFDRLSNEVGL